MIEFKNNPFESGHIKNYLLLYGSIVVIMVLFFIAGELFIEDKEIEQKNFDTDKHPSLTIQENQPQEEKEFKPKFKLLENAY